MHYYAKLNDNGIPTGDVVKRKAIVYNDPRYHLIETVKQDKILSIPFPADPLNQGYNFRFQVVFNETVIADLLPDEVDNIRVGSNAIKIRPAFTIDSIVEYLKNFGTCKRVNGSFIRFEPSAGVFKKNTNYSFKIEITLRP